MQSIVKHMNRNSVWHCREAQQLLRHVFKAGELGSGASRPAQPGPNRTGSTDPKTEVKRILSAKTHYAVLEVETNADEESVKRAKKMKSLLVHPDKAGNLAGAGDAFGKVIDVSTCMTIIRHNTLSMLVTCRGW